MTELRISDMHIYGKGFGSTVSGSVKAKFGKRGLEFELSESAVQEILAIGLAQVQAQQAALAEEIASAQPLQLAAPEYTEFTPVDDAA